LHAFLLKNVRNLSYRSGLSFLVAYKFMTINTPPERQAEIDHIMAICFLPKVRQGMHNRYFNKFRTQAVEFEEAFQRAAVKLLEHLHRNPEKTFNNTAHVASYLWMTLRNEVIKFKGKRVHENTCSFTNYVVSINGYEEFDVDHFLPVSPADVFAEEPPYDTRLADLARVYYSQLQPDQQLLIATYLRLGSKNETAEELGLSANMVGRAMNALQKKCRAAAAVNSLSLSPLVASGSPAQLT
jgi:DNA-directed RNA polymerase specialized sigma24 family protein